MRKAGSVELQQFKIVRIGLDQRHLRIGKAACPQHGGHSNIASQVHDIFDVFRVDRIQVIFVVKKYLFEDKQVGCARPVMKWHRSAVESKVDGSSSGAQGA